MDNITIVILLAFSGLLCGCAYWLGHIQGVRTERKRQPPVAFVKRLPTNRIKTARAAPDDGTRSSRVSKAHTYTTRKRPK